MEQQSCMEQTSYTYEIEYDVIDEEYVYSYSGNIKSNHLLTEDDKDEEIIQKLHAFEGIGIDNVEIKAIKLLH